MITSKSNAKKDKVSFKFDSESEWLEFKNGKIQKSKPFFNDLWESGESVYDVMPKLGFESIGNRDYFNYDGELFIGHFQTTLYVKRNDSIDWPYMFIVEIEPTEDFSFYVSVKSMIDLIAFSKEISPFLTIFGTQVFRSEDTREHIFKGR